MKIASLLYLIGITSVSVLRAQAPAAVSGQTYRSISQVYSGDFPENTFRVVDLASDGTFVDRLELSRQANFEELTYQPLVNGTYTYTVQSPTQGLLTLVPTGGNPQIHALSFASPSAGTLGADSGPAAIEFGNFSVSPTVSVGTTGGLRNVSTIVSLLPGNSTTVGFIVGGTQVKEYVVRCVGPTLATLGVSNCAANPTYTLGWGPFFGEELQFPGEQQGYAGEPAVGWSATAAAAATIAAESARVGAFPLTIGSNDKSDVILLSPASYTIGVAPSNAAEAGAQLIEVYEVP